MIKLKGLITEEVDKIWHVYDPHTRDQIDTFAIVKAPNFQTALQMTKAESSHYTAEVISAKDVTRIKAQLKLRLKETQKVLKNIKV